jgi:isoleucyl-tRNA synthetase
VSDRVVVAWQTSDEELAAAIADHEEWIAAEVLATGMERSDAADEVVAVLDTSMQVGIVRG